VENGGFWMRAKVKIILLLLKFPVEIMLKRLIYVSRPLEEFGPDVLLEMLKSARLRNGKRDISGYLLYKNCYFMQYLEGEKADIDHLYQKIIRDPRHTDIFTVYLGQGEERLFADWEMGFMGPEEFTGVKGLDTDVMPRPLMMDPRSRDDRAIITILKTFASNQPEMAAIS
jgi:hypothetical protein